MSVLFKEFGFDRLQHWMYENQLQDWANVLQNQVDRGLSIQRFGDLPFWLEALNRLPEIENSLLTVDASVTVTSEAISELQKVQLRQALEDLIPWRKGPYDLYGIHIDTEWRSNKKWDRLKTHIAPLKDRLVLDVGCGNGYHMWRMLAEGAKRVIGVDPSPRFSVQFEMIKRLAGKEHPVDLIPIPMDAVPRPLEAFDTVFSMGVLYHRKDHMLHLAELFDSLMPEGELVLESLVIEGTDTECLIPKGRYAKMRNVWAVPSSAMIVHWLQQAGFVNIRVINESVTTLDEQRATEWMRFESLANFLNAEDHSKTIEGHPAPRRAILLAQKP